MKINGAQGFLFMSRVKNVQSLVAQQLILTFLPPKWIKCVLLLLSCCSNLINGKRTPSTATSVVWIVWMPATIIS